MSYLTAVMRNGMAPQSVWTSVVNEKTMSPTVFVCKITNVTGGRDGTMFIKHIQLVTQASRPGSGSPQSTSKLSRPGVCLSSHHSEDGDRQTVPGEADLLD